MKRFTLILFFVLGMGAVAKADYDFKVNCDGVDLYFSYACNLGEEYAYNEVVLVPFSLVEPQYVGVASITIPGYVKGNGSTYKVVAIYGNAFFNCPDLQEVLMPSTVRNIYYHGFYQCQNLSKVTIGASVTNLESQSFAYCPQLRQVDLPESLVGIEASAFDNCPAVELTIPGGVKKLNAICKNGGPTKLFLEEGVQTISSFQKNQNLESICLPSTLAEIPSSCFMQSPNLKSVTFAPGSSYAIPGQTFSGCTNLESVSLGGAIPSIGANAFNGTSISQIDLSGVSAIGNSAFYGSALASVKVPESVTSLGYMVFYNCTSLTSAIINAQVPKLGSNLFQNCESLKTVYISPSVTEIGVSCFNNCKSLGSVVVPEGVEIISDKAFYGCVSLTTVTLPSTLKTVGKNVFANDTQINCLKVKGTDPNAFSLADAGLSKSNITLYVPRGCKDAYANSSRWSGYKEIKELSPRPQDVNEDDSVNGADAVSIYNYIIKGEESGLAKVAADVNEDDSVNGADVVSIYNYITSGK